MTDTLTAYLGLGANLGARRETLRQARQALAALPGVELLAWSRLYEGAAVGGPAGQPDYLNAVLAVATKLEPLALLRRCLQVEADLGRERSVRWGARTIDIDLLLMGELVLDSRELQLPHPRLHQREFVLRPLAELSPELLHPLQQLTVAQLLAALPASTLACHGDW